ncbi:MAG: PAS domain-containing protein [Acidovorax sp.]|uniref:sensor histidine kinase n=1 Tax=Acidovorax sp. TaxID=1872122 RepID=UPI0022C63456|nr:PAS domain-containing protein [Acidovorax sp.]MCZ8218081.1 PAS domain-containing protein [Acidovorax sp.]
MQAFEMQSPLWRAAMETIFLADSPVGKAVLDRDYRYVLINKTLASFNGKSVEEHIGRTVQEVLPEAFPSLIPMLDQVISECRSTHFRITVEMPGGDGRQAEWEASYLPIRLPDGSVGGIYVQAVNLTAKLLAERALAESEKHLRRVLDSLFAFVGVLSPDGTLIQANRAPLDAAGIDANEVIGKPFWDTYWWSYSDEVQEWLRSACARVAAGEIVRKDIFVRMKGDSRMCLDFMLVPMRDDEGNVTHLIPSAIDISDRLAAQQRTETALRERTVLLQEVHHRVKNNLQIIASLLRLQARSASPAVALALQDSENRVMAMSLTHQLLYERTDFSSLELGAYLKRLVGSLRDAHGRLMERIRLTVDAPDSGLQIELSQAVPVALVVNELLTNALKHAFAPDCPGTIELRAAAVDDGISVTVRDDGCGLPADSPFAEGSTLGFSLVTLLTQQLGADMAWPQPGRPGATFVLSLPMSTGPI